MTETLVTPSFLSLNDSQYTKNTYEIEIWNLHASNSVTYNVSSIGAALASPFKGGDDAVQLDSLTSYTAKYANVHFQSDSSKPFLPNLLVTLKAGETKKVTIRFSHPIGANATLFPIYSGYIIVTNLQAVTPAARIPYAGMVGNWYSAAIWSTNSPSMYYAEGAIKYIYPSYQEISIGSTGIYYPNTYLPIKANEVVYASTGLIMSIIAATSSRFAEVRVINSMGQSYIAAVNYYYFDLMPLVISPLERMAPYNFQNIGAPIFVYWNGYVLDGNNTVQLLSGTYQIGFYALRHFADLNGPPAENMHTILSPKFQLVTF